MCNYDSGMLLIELAYSQHTHTHTYIQQIYLLIRSGLLCDLFYNFRHLTSFSTFMWSTQERTIFNQIFERLMKQQQQPALALTTTTTTTKQTNKQAKKPLALRQIQREKSMKKNTKRKEIKTEIIKN